MIQPYNLPPINPAAFGGLPEAPQGGQQQPPQGGQGQPPMDMNKYLIDKVMEIKRRMGGGGSMGALGAISEAMMQQPQQQPQPQGEEIPPQPQQTMRA